MAELHVNLLSPAKVIARQSASYVKLPSVKGQIGILPGHTKIVSEIGVGELTLEDPTGQKSYFVSGGYAEVENDQVTLLIDIIERPEDIDVTRAQKAKERAASRMAKITEGVDNARAMAALMRATERLAISMRK